MINSAMVDSPKEAKVSSMIFIKIILSLQHGRGIRFNSPLQQGHLTQDESLL